MYQLDLIKEYIKLYINKKLTINGEFFNYLYLLKFVLSLIALISSGEK